MHLETKKYARLGRKIKLLLSDGAQIDRLERINIYLVLEQKKHRGSTLHILGKGNWHHTSSVGSSSFSFPTRF